MLQVLHQHRNEALDQFETNLSRRLFCQVLVFDQPGHQKIGIGPYLSQPHVSLVFLLLDDQGFLELLDEILLLLCDLVLLSAGAF